VRRRVSVRERRIIVVIEATVVEKECAAVGQPRVWSAASPPTVGGIEGGGHQQQQRNAYGGAPQAQVQGYGAPQGGHGASPMQQQQHHQQQQQPRGGGYGGGGGGAGGRGRG